MHEVKDLLKRYLFSWSQLQYIFSTLFSRDILRLYIEKETVSAHIIRQLDYIASLYRDGMPLEYIVGRSGFYGLNLKVNPSVLIPRPETEIMVEKVVDYLGRTKSASFRVLDLGVGCGNISIALAGKANLDIVVIGSDISLAALGVAKENINYYGYKNIRLLCADMLSAFKEDSFDVIVANLPYVESDYLKSNTALQYEPSLALEGGKDGLVFIRAIIDQAGRFLKKGGRIFIEIGYSQAEKVKKYIENSLFLCLAGTFLDYSGKERIIVAQRKD